MALRISLLGPLALELNGTPVTLPARKSEGLLAMLALRPGVTLGREQLAARLWPDVAEAQSRTSLRQALGHLRRSLPEELIVAQADRLHLDPALASVDAAELAALLERPPIDRLAATRLLRGALLEGFPALEQPFDDWLTDERRALTDKVSRRLEECLAALSASGRFEEAELAGSAVIAVEPTRESAHRALMRLAAERGERALALGHYERCAELLRRKLDVPPSDETEKLRRQIEAGESSRPPAAAPASQRAPESRASQLSIAILPFESVPDHGETRLLSDALREDVTTELSRYRELGVIARTSVNAVYRPGMSLEQLARETGARLVLSGSVRGLGQQTRVTAELIDATTGLQVWAERWEVSGESPFSALERLARSVVGALALKLDETRLSQARKRPHDRLPAYECWLRGLDCLRRGSEESDAEARALFEQALRVEPGFARAYAGISLSHFNDWSCQAWERWDERERLAFEYAQRAVALDDGDHVSHYILGRIRVYRREFAEGERHLDQALALNSSDPNALMHCALAYCGVGKPELACELVEQALRLNPKHPDWYYTGASVAHFFAHRLERGIELGLRAPDSLVDSRAYLAAASALLGREQEAADHARRFLEHFRLKISPRGPRDAKAALAWLIRVNPLKRESDAEYLLSGLSRAGLDVAS